MKEVGKIITLAIAILISLALSVEFPIFDWVSIILAVGTVGLSASYILRK